MSGRRA